MNLLRMLIDDGEGFYLQISNSKMSCATNFELILPSIKETTVLDRGEMKNMNVVDIMRAPASC